MKKRSKALAALLCMVMAVSVGCGGKAPEEKQNKADAAEEKKSGETEELEEEKPDEKLTWIREAIGQYHDAEIQENIMENTFTLQDGSTRSSKNVTIIDTGRQAVMEKYIEDMENITFYTKEGDNEYMYTTTYLTDPNTGEAVESPVKVLVSGADESFGTYSDRVEKSETEIFESNDYMEYSDVKVTEEGEEEIDGTAVVKLKVDYVAKVKEEEKITRESVLEHQELTEEDIAILEGMSDALDAYVAESNAQADERMNNTEVQSEIFYLTADEHKLVRTETEASLDDDMAMRTFWDMSSKLSWIKDLTAEGMGLEEAKAFANENFSGGDYSNPDISQLIVCTYLTGDACEPIGDLPADAREITWEQYMNGEM